MNSSQLLKQRTVNPRETVLNTAEMRLGLGNFSTPAANEWKPAPTDDEIRAALERVTGIPQWAIIVTGTYDMQDYLPWIGECIMVDFEVRKPDMRLYELEGIRVDLRKYGVKWINGNAWCSVELKTLMAGRI